MTVPSLTTYQQGQAEVNADGLNTFVQTADSVTQLRAYIGIQGQEVDLKGFVSPGDGGQGNFYWNAAGTGPDDGGITNIVPTGASLGCWTRINGTTGLLGALYYTSTTQNILNDGNWHPVTCFNSQSYDDGIGTPFFNSTTQQFIIPSNLGITRVRFTAQVVWANISNAGRHISLSKNGVLFPNGGFIGIPDLESTESAMTGQLIVTPMIEVVQGDYFQVQVLTSNASDSLGAVAGTNPTRNGQATYFAMEILSPLNLSQSNIVGGSGINVEQGTLAIASPINTTIPLVAYAQFSSTINQINNLVVSSGSIVLTIQINGVNVTGLTNITVTSTPQNPMATANNVLAVGQEMDLILSSNSSAANLKFTMKSTT